MSLGAIMRICDSFYFGAEVTPQIFYSKRDDSDALVGSKVVTTKASLGTKNAILLLIYRFN